MNDFETLINPEKYQVFLMACRCRLPVSFAYHMWFVINKKGVTARYEVLIEEEPGILHWGHLHKDALPLFRGFGLLETNGKQIWPSKFLGSVEGDEGSLAQKMIEKIESTKDIYPYLHHYRLLGPNSNTYIQWVLAQFPESQLKVPWTAFGAGFKVEV